MNGSSFIAKKSKRTLYHGQEHQSDIYAAANGTVGPSTIELINAKQLATLLSISERTLYRLKSMGELPMPVILGGSVRWRLAS